MIEAAPSVTRINGLIPEILLTITMIRSEAIARISLPNAYMPVPAL